MIRWDTNLSMAQFSGRCYLKNSLQGSWRYPESPLRPKSPSWCKLKYFDGTALNRNCTTLLCLSRKNQEGQPGCTCSSLCRRRVRSEVLPREVTHWNGVKISVDGGVSSGIRFGIRMPQSRKPHCGLVIYSIVLVLIYRDKFIRTFSLCSDR